jgi:hypothetical protein
MAVINQVIVEVFHVVERQLQGRNIGASTSTPGPTPGLAQTTTSTSSSPTATMSSQQQSSGPTSSPLLFFVALGFGVVFTNLW